MNDELIIQRVAYCPHCGNRAPQKLVHTQRYHERSWASDGKESDPVPSSMFVAVCQTCHQILLYENFTDFLEGDQFTAGDLVFPDFGRLHSSVPELIRKIYEEARRIREIAPNAFAVQIRRALEALCEDRETKKGSLQQRLDELASRGEIPATLAEAGHNLRLVGNLGAHLSETSVHPLWVRTIDDFFRAIVEYVYVAPKKLQAFKDRMKQYSNDASTTQ